MIVRIATRGSRLARWQAEWVANHLCSSHVGLKVQFVEVKTHGDCDRDSPLSEIGGTGLFTKEIQNAVLGGLADVAVHSLKDLPAQTPPELILAAVPTREDVADAIVAADDHNLQTLPLGARIGTSSPRRRAQLLHLRPDLDVRSVRGNVESRVNQVLDGKLEAIVLAWAGLHRLGLHRHVTHRLEPPEFLPAIGQGALGVECRRDDPLVSELLLSLDDPSSHRAVLAERAVLSELEGGCSIPIAAWARELADKERGQGVLAIDAAFFDIHGRTRVSVALTGPKDDPQGLGKLTARALRTKGTDLMLVQAEQPMK
jgi:hydroxymethylbilane synthase